MNAKLHLTKHIYLAVLAAFLAACSGATISAPQIEVEQPPADIGPLLSYGILQHTIDELGEDIPDAWMGYSIALGDFNGDGQRDIAAGAPRRGSGQVTIRYSGGRNSPERLASFGFTQLGLSSTTNDDLGWSLASADFNRDGYADLAVGAPRRDLHGVAEAGMSIVVYGSSSGLDVRHLTQIAQGDDGNREAGDHLGWSLAAGDFNGDGYADLVIGAPGENYREQDAGAVLVRWGSRNGLNRAFSPTLIVPVEPQAGAQFGYALAAGRFQTAWQIGHGGHDDLAISSPFRDVTEYSVTAQKDLTYHDAGEITFYWGILQGSYGLERGSSLVDHLVDEPRLGFSLAVGGFNGCYLDQLAAGAPHLNNGRGYVAIIKPLYHAEVLYRVYQPPDGLEEAGDEFGYALAAGDFNNDHSDDLAIGAPFEDWNGKRDAGLVYIRFGSNGQLTDPCNPPSTSSFTSAYFLRQNGEIGGLEADDRFGMALAAGDLTNDGNADLVIGSPYEDIDINGRSLTNVGVYFVARSRAPEFGFFEGLWTGTLEGDSGSSAPVNLSLLDRNRIIAGTATIRNPGITIRMTCTLRNGSGDTGRQSLQVNGRVDEDQAGNELRDFSVSNSIQVEGYDVPYRLNLTVLSGENNRRMRARFVVGPVDLGIAGSCDARTFETILTRQ